MIYRRVHPPLFSLIQTVSVVLRISLSISLSPGDVWLTLNPQNLLIKQQPTIIVPHLKDRFFNCNSKLIFRTKIDHLTDLYLKLRLSLICIYYRQFFACKDSDSSNV